MVYVFNPSNWKAEVCVFLSLWPAWFKELQDSQGYRDPVLKNKQTKQQLHHKNKMLF